MGLDIGRIKQRQAETQAQKGDRWVPKDGVNRIRVFKFTHKVSKEDVKAGHYAKEKLGKMVEELDRPLTVHFNVSKDNRPVASNETLLKEWRRLSSSPDAKDQAQAKAIQPQTKYAINVVDVMERPVVMRHWLAPRTVYNDVLAKVLDEDFGEDILGSSGREFTITFDKTKKGSDMYSTSVRDKEKCAKLPGSLDEKALDFYSVEGLAALGILQQGTPEEPGDKDDEDPKEEEDEDPKKGEDDDEKPKKDEDDEDPKDEDEDEGEEDEEDEEKPKKGKKK